MLDLLSKDEAKQVRDLFREANYTEAGVVELSGSTELPMPDGINWRPMLDRTTEANRFHLLARWFWLATAVPKATAEQVMPRWFVEMALRCGLVQADGDYLLSEVMIAPYDDYLVASDCYSRLMSGGHVDHVLTIGAAPQHLLNFVVRTPVMETLDVGCGNGIQALAAAKHSQRVTATDLNPRATQYARFNAALNGVDHLECLTGDAFAPVAGRRFDLICTNPPFVLTPSTESIFRDSPKYLDEFCHQLVREAPDHLNPGGYFQMICEWVEVEGQSWQERLADWFKGTGCDVWVLKVNSQRPEYYAAQHISDDRRWGIPTESYDAWMDNYRLAKVSRIHGGFIAMRLRSGPNWLRIQEAATWIEAPFGDMIVRGFKRHDFLQTLQNEQQLFEAHLELAPDVRLEQESRPGAGRWEPTKLRLRLTGGFPQMIEAEPTATNFLARFDGKHTVREHAERLTEESSGNPEQVRAGLLNLVQELLRKGFLTAADAD